MCFSSKIIKHFSFNFILVVPFILILIGCIRLKNISEEKIETNPFLERLNWQESNYILLRNLILDYGIGGKYYNKDKKPYCLIDWDNTCIVFDSQEAFLRYQIENFKFRLSKEGFRNLLKDNINGVTELYVDSDFIDLNSINSDLNADYSFLFDNLMENGGTISLDSIKKTSAYIDFRAKLPLLYDGYCNTSGIGAEYGYPWVITLAAGFTTDEIRGMAESAFKEEIGKDLEFETWESSDDHNSECRKLEYTFKKGLRVVPEMQNLLKSLELSGFEIFIVSASYKPIIEVFSGKDKFGFDVNSMNIIAMELEVDNRGVVLPDYKLNWFKTQRQGKVEAVNAVREGLGLEWEPVLIAGDSDGDYEMLTAYKNAKIGIIWNRLKGGDIGKLCLSAVRDSLNETPRYILQGRDENKGITIPEQGSILLGENSRRLLRKENY